MKRNYPYIVAAGRLHGSNSEYVQSEILAATRAGAPADAWSYDTDNKRWRTMTELKQKADAGNYTAGDTWRKLTSLVATSESGR